MHSFGPERDQLHGYDGYLEIELALARLYEATKEQRYLTLGNYFVEQRGTEYEKRQQSCVSKSDGAPWMKTKRIAKRTCRFRSSGLQPVMRFALYTS
ncbi:beta-L-arabinofuranosidase domain-containing protein [Bradyrhizobium vignae]|uniref:beta-L-arabinofuranosidase domain-containing protein n=1 Tax=Bradyrhizobium vignae TaxID=1549949 RepID=UPI003D3175AE